ncbi:unnamed protein product, partial [Adineta steineri]
GKICRTGRPAFNPPVTTTTTTTTQNNNNNNNNNNNTNNNNNNYKNNSNNNNNNTTKVPASAPPQSNGSSPESTTSAENHSTPPSQTNNNHLSENQLLSAKSFHNLASLRLRREMSQPALSRVELTCSTDSSSEKNGTNDSLSLHSRPNVNYRLSQQPDIRQKQYKLNPARLSIEYLPVRQISRSRVYDNPPSPK